MENNLTQDPFLRIKAAKVLRLIDLMGELGLATYSVTRHPAIAKMEIEGYESAAHRLELLTRQVQELASSLRLVPMNEIFARMHRLARDLSQQTGKKFEMIVLGEAVEIDKIVVDKLTDPLIHLIRNAVDHGLESTAERRAAGKPEQGSISLEADQQGQEIHITVADDGRGLSRQGILKKARAEGLVRQDEEPDDATVWNLIFRSGFSTADQISNLSGRGVGMDVVQSSVRSLRGRVTVETTPGKGTRVTLIIPLTLAFLEAMIVRSQRRLYAIPIEAIRQVFKPSPGEIVNVSASGAEFVRRQDTIMPILRLYDGEGTPTPLIDQIILVAQTSHGPLGLPVDEIVGEQQVMMKPLEGHMHDIRGGAGCALLGSGEIAIALNVDELGASLLGQTMPARIGADATR